MPPTWTFIEPLLRTRHLFKSLYMAYLIDLAAILIIISEALLPAFYQRVDPKTQRWLA